MTNSALTTHFPGNTSYVKVLNTEEGERDKRLVRNTLNLRKNVSALVRWHSRQNMGDSTSPSR